MWKFVIALVFSASLPVFAKKSPGPSAKACADVEKACSKKKGKAKVHECVSNVLAGKPVKGVKVKAATIKDCKAAKGKKKADHAPAAKAKEKALAPPPTPAPAAPATEEIPEDFNLDAPPAEDSRVPDEPASDDDALLPDEG